jgi:hypothetical protein
VSVPVFEGASMSFDSDVGIFLGNQVDPGPGALGMLCKVHRAPGVPDTLDLDQIVDGAIVQESSQPLPFGTGISYRLRLSERGGVYLCEGFTSGVPSASVSSTVSDPTWTSQFMVLRATNVEAHFASVVVESTLP